MSAAETFLNPRVTVADVAPVVIYNTTTMSYPARSTATSSTTTPVTWVGPVDPVASGALAVDIWQNTGGAI